MNSCQPSSTSQWKTELTNRLRLLGHRNWIAVTDAAYPAQSNHGVTTTATGDDLIDVLHYTLRAIDESEHIRPTIYTDMELRYVAERDAPRATEYRILRDKALQGRTVHELEHEGIISMIDGAGALFQVVVLKTTLTIPYSSVFIELDCGYWSTDAEDRLRESIANQSAPVLVNGK